MSSSICRVCLNGNLRMNRIENIELQNIFAKLSNFKVNKAAVTYGILLQKRAVCASYNMARESSSSSCHTEINNEFK